MGWYGIPEVKNIKEVKDYLLARTKEGCIVLDSVIKKDHIWALYRISNNIISADCYLVDNRGGQLSYKPLGIEDCPFKYDIPKKWLHQLTPVDEREKISNERLPNLREWFEGVSKFNNQEMEADFE